MEPTNSGREIEGKPSMNPANPSGSLWGLFTSDPTAAVSIVDASGRVLWVNLQSVRVFLGENAKIEDAMGKTFEEIGFPRAWADERRAILQSMKDDNRAILLRTIWRGKQQVSWIRRIEADAAGMIEGTAKADGPTYLVITRRIAGDVKDEDLMPEKTEVVQSQVVGLGPLSILTNRELEVLALVGHGLSTKEIAKMLFRAEKTIERHRESIAKKLGESKNIRLAEIASEAGLVAGDAERQRV